MPRFKRKKELVTGAKSVLGLGKKQRKWLTRHTLADKNDGLFCLPPKPTNILPPSRSPRLDTYTRFFHPRDRPSNPFRVRRKPARRRPFLTRSAGVAVTAAFFESRIRFRTANNRCDSKDRVGFSQTRHPVHVPCSWLDRVRRPIPLTRVSRAVSRIYGPCCFLTDGRDGGALIWLVRKN